MRNNLMPKLKIGDKVQWIQESSWPEKMKQGRVVGFLDKGKRVIIDTKGHPGFKLRKRLYTPWTSQVAKVFLEAGEL